MIKYYRLKNYLNASHFVVFNGRKGNVHPHTWEFSTLLVSTTEEITKFTDTEKKISAIFEPYQNRVLNELAPFDSINPSLENMTEYFIKRIEKAVEGLGYKLVEVEGSETPVRTFGIRVSDDFMDIKKKNIIDISSKKVIPLKTNRIKGITIPKKVDRSGDKHSFKKDNTNIKQIEFKAINVKDLIYKLERL